jgi:GTP-binding protein Era
MNETRCGYVALIGRPNVGKSTLLNRLIGQKLSITSSKPQTTRHRLLGIKSEGSVQIIYVDTPGLHQRQASAMNRYLNRAASSSLVDVDVIIWMLEALRWTKEDEHVLNLLKDLNVPVILAVNKVDKVTGDKSALLPYLQDISAKFSFCDVFPISAYHGDNLEALETKIGALLPQGEWIYPEDQITDRSERFLSTEIIREKLVRRLGDELPYQLTVQIEYFTQRDHLIHISAIIWVERSGQKAIVIGKNGSVLKVVGEQARLDLEKMLDSKVFLQLWVKVKEGWHDSEQALQQLGYSDKSF